MLLSYDQSLAVKKSVLAVFFGLAEIVELVPDSFIKIQGFESEQTNGDILV